MLTIRQNVFETNSSSTHSMCVTNKGISEIENYIGKTMDFELGDYDWGWDVLYDPQEKLNYLLTALAYKKYPLDYYPIINKHLEKHGIHFDCPIPENPHYKHLLEQIEDTYGYGIDHESIDDSVKFAEEMLENDQRLIDYLFNTNSFVIIGNDNSEMAHEYFEEHITPDYAYSMGLDYRDDQSWEESEKLQGFKDYPY